MSYEHVKSVDGWRIVRHPVTKKLYVSWYDKAVRQTRRASLGTDDAYEAYEKATKIRDAGVDDPRDFLKRETNQTVRDVLAGHRAYVESKPSSDIENINIDIILRSPMADRKLTALGLEDFDRLREFWSEQGSSVATVSRRLSTLRSALRQAEIYKRIAPGQRVFVPEFRKKHHIMNAAPKGHVCEEEELAKLYRAAEAPHLRLVLFLLLNTAARLGAVLDLSADQLKIEDHLIDLNPKGRVQTKKHRPVLPMTRQLANWSTHLRQFDGTLVTYRGRAVASMKTAMRAAVQSAGLPKNTNTYSVRHAIGRILKKRASAPRRSPAGSATRHRWTILKSPWSTAPMIPPT